MNLIKKIGGIILPIFVYLIYFFLYIPVIILIIFSFNKSVMSYSWTGFTLKWYYLLFQNLEIWIALRNSLIIGASAVILSITIGTLLVWGLATRFYYLISLFYTTMMIPDVVLSVGLLILFSFFSIPLGFTTLIAGHTLLGLGLAVPIIYSRFTEIDYQVIEASLNLGATEWQTFIKVILPFLLPSLYSAAVSVFILSFDDFLVSFFCSGSTSQTLSLYIFSVIRTGVSPVINALSTLILVLSTIFVFIFSYLKIKPKRPRI